MPTYDKDYYRTLQVHPEAEPEVIQAAYRRLARKYHPDSSDSDGARMQELNEAYSVLSDAKQRAAYNRWLRPGRRGPRPAGGAPASVPPSRSPFWLLRAIAPTALSLLLLAILVLDLFRIGLRGVPEVTLLLIALGWLVYHFGGLKDLWRG